MNTYLEGRSSEEYKVESGQDLTGKLVPPPCAKDSHIVAIGIDSIFPKGSTYDDIVSWGSSLAHFYLESGCAFR